jgi:hypothetical protein
LELRSAKRHLFPSALCGRSNRDFNASWTKAHILDDLRDGVIFFAPAKCPAMPFIARHLLAEREFSRAHVSEYLHLRAAMTQA